MTVPALSSQETPLGWKTPADGAGPLSPDAAWPQPIKMSFGQVLSALNPLQHIPIVGRIYRAETGNDIPAPLKILGAGLFGGPLGILGAAVGELFGEIFAMGPDTSRPAVPAGMQETGSEAGMEPVSPGTMAKGQYLTLATTQPEWLRPSSPEELAMVGDPRRGMSVYKTASDTMIAMAGNTGGGMA